MTAIRILGTGKFLPGLKLTASELDLRQGYSAGSTLRHSGVETRYFVTHETASYMGAQAAKLALQAAKLGIADVDCIVCCSGTREQAMPATAALISLQLGPSARGIPAFDINATCLSFLTGLDLLSFPIQLGRFQKVLLISSDIASVGLDWQDKESCTLFGDGAAAVIIGKSEVHESSKIITANMETYSEGAHYTEIPGGGTRFHPRDVMHADGHPHLFQMAGRKVYKLSAQVLPDFLRRLFVMANMTMAEVDLVIPHQASLPALNLMRKKLAIPEEKMLITVQRYGNTVAASIPMALHDAEETGRIKRGDKLLLLGTAAGLMVGGMILEY
jgi:3-oxoacyl-[acyl-carrier-protein] synthase-3